MNLEKFEATGATLEELAAPEVREGAPYVASAGVPLEDRWIFSRLGHAVAQVNGALESMRFHEAAFVVYHFFWGDFCDWYIEWVKPRLFDSDHAAATVAWKNLFAAFEAALRLLHPFMPFLTEELWHQLPQRAGAKSIALDRFPEARAAWMDDAVEQQVSLLQEIVTAARNIRAEMKLEPKRKVAADFSTPDASVRALVEANLDVVLRLGALSALQFSSGHFDAAGGAIRSTAEFDLRIAYAEAVDLGAELARLRKEKERMKKDIESKRGRLADQTFRSRAPEDIVRGLENTLAERTVEYEKLAVRLAQLEKSAGGATAP